MENNCMEYIVVQAGGRGSRLGSLTRNKPKALVPIENLPMLFHLSKKYPESRFIIVADYKKDVMHKYLQCFFEADHVVVDANGMGTCAGIREALEYVPAHSPFMLIWSDLILASDFRIPAETRNYIGISQTFTCRWSYKNGSFEEQSSMEYGVAGLFVFQSKQQIEDVPESGEFVAWLSQKGLNFRTIGLAGTREFGTIEDYKKLRVEKTRPFNRITEKDGILIKEGVDEQGLLLARIEANWYKVVMERGFKSIPSIYNLDPICMEKIDGMNAYEYGYLPTQKKKEVIVRIVDALKELHSLGYVSTDSNSIEDTYIYKTFNRLDAVKELIPFNEEKSVIVNGLECRNIYYYRNDLIKAFKSYSCPRFELIHGDCTFSNTMLDRCLNPIFIDPRGYFGKTAIFGDPMYDWAKLYYSIVGNYDRFNLRDFELRINEHGAQIEIASNGWEDTGEYFLNSVGADAASIRLIHAVIWLSLTTYAWHDYDSICGAFYNGLYYLEEALS